MGFPKERIEHLSKEIEAVTANLMTFRTRIGFTVLIGPFIIMGSVLLATDGKVTVPKCDYLFIVSLIISVVSYFFLGLYGAQLDKHMSDKNNDWRQAIIELSKGKEPMDEEFKFTYRTREFYLLGFAIVLTEFVSVTFCISCVLPNY